MIGMFRDLIEKSNLRRERDAETYHALDAEECMLCNAYGADKRSLFIDCGYAIHEVVPEAPDIRALVLDRGRGYYLLICKSCRGRLLGALQGWANECRSLRGLPKDHDGNLSEDDPERNIPVRINGAIRMLTRDEYEAFRAGQEPPA